MAITRDSWSGTVSAGDVITAANLNNVAGGWIGLGVTTSDQTGITSETDLTDLAVTINTEGNRVLLFSFVTRVARTVNDGQTIVRFKESTTTLQSAVLTPASASAGDTVSAFYFASPSAGSHTYKLTLQQSSGTGTSGITANANTPSYLLVQDVGPLLNNP